MEYVVVDTSSILFGFASHKSVFEAIQAELGKKCLVSKGIINELNKISTGKGTRGAIAKVALRELSLKRIKIEASSKYPDSWIKEKAQGKQVSAVVTNDTALASAIKKDVVVFKFSRDGKLKRFR